MKAYPKATLDDNLLAHRLAIARRQRRNEHKPGTASYGKWIKDNPPQPEIKPDVVKVMLLKVGNEYFNAYATWKKVYGVWGCVAADPDIRWLLGCNQDRAKLELLKRGCKWEWLPPEDVPVKDLKYVDAERTSD